MAAAFGDLIERTVPKLCKEMPAAFRLLIIHIQEPS